CARAYNFWSGPLDFW
nr:immunoglobulin heavy chain junction region [Macaca mulatta]MOW76606.1 immunoglobulin heavy chain junction region [Macaca mulatta]MOW76938.1 immunoglobulin heavy chain junction region [Macaca mulatta]MOW77585.1 immunoglobulin heavy chain junction region [Macaca mulatta]MOW79403.1 immunoglobulin heavy chain junction region [Macaca mulatta]